MKQYRTTRNRLVEFIREVYHKNDVSLEFVDFRFINSFDIYLKEKHKNNLNTAWGYHKQIKKILNLAIALDYLDKSPYLKFKVKKQEPNREFLTLTELNKMHIRQGEAGEDWIVIDRTKTSTRCRIPLLPSAKQILELYENYPVCQSKGRLLPALSNQKMNSYLKELADICGINKNLSMHVARHTFAASVTITNGVPIETVSKILGHTSIRTTQTYARVLESKISEDMKSLKSRLKM